MNPVARQRRGQLHIGEDETLIVWRALEIHPERMAGRTVGAVAPDQPGCLEGFFLSIAPAQGGAHALARLGKAFQLHAAFDQRQGLVVAVLSNTSYADTPGLAVKIADTFIEEQN